MGDGMHHLFRELFREDFKPSRRKRTFQSGSGDFMWRTASGESINMYDMTPEHRENAMNICRGRGNTGKLKQLEQVQREMEKVKRHDDDRSRNHRSRDGTLDDRVPS
ncbi:hypothetical protein IB276_33200 [Ensifer sp. ENS04]|uniref:hypothetical protein n=1 Tax=Ensifer sp. ENS04 TaxID=2769281 RepID=UPI001784728F|nr:hypothetical protein [Ensifer sp. ENS04]MBD9544305.1 hypothetical protein [Ensifer sp. ENS04]